MQSLGGAGGPNDAGTSSRAQTQPTAPKKRRSNVNKACENCRRRRVKCDGIRPSCTTCKVYKDDCFWDPREDYRKPLSRQQVQALVTRVQDLERLLRQNGVDPGKSESTEEIKLDPDRDGDYGHEHEHEHGDQIETSGGGSEDIREWSQEHLVEGESGELQVHGPTSAFRHLGKYGPEAYRETSPLSPSALPVGFARYLPQDVFMTEEHHNQAIDRFFRFYAPWCQRTNPILFRQDMAIALGEKTPPKTPHYSPMLHNAILAIALGFSDEPFLRNPHTRKTFIEKAKGFIDHEGMTPSVATVQAFAHLASYHSLSAEHNLGWLYIGMALRCAIALGLHMEDSKLLKRGNVTPAQARERNVTFWTAFVQEGLWSPYIGRTMSLPDYTALAPTIDEELDQLVWENTDAPLVDGEPVIRSQPGMISTNFVETVKLMRIGEKIMNTLYGIKADMSTLVRTGVISEISLSLSTWLENLPPALTFHNHSPKNGLPHILMMHLSHSWLVILLHRPFYRPLAGLPNGPGSGASGTTTTATWAVKQCDKAAIQVIALLQTWHRLHDLRFAPPTALQCCFVAGTTHLLSLASSRTAKKRSEALARARECIRLMGFMAVTWPAAQQNQILLENLLAEYGMSVSSSRDERDEREPTLVGGGRGTGEHDHDHEYEHERRPSHRHSQSQPQDQSSQIPIPIYGTPSTSQTGSYPLYHNAIFSDHPTISPVFINPQHQQQHQHQHQQQSHVQQQRQHHQNAMLQTPLGIDDLSAWIGTSISDTPMSAPMSISGQSHHQPPQTPSYHQSATPHSLSHSQSQSRSFTSNYDPSLSLNLTDIDLASSLGQQHTDWDPSLFSFPPSELDRETQALLDNLLQPHLDVGHSSQAQGQGHQSRGGGNVGGGRGGDRGNYQGEFGEYEDCGYGGM